MRVALINGPNLRLLKTRQPEVYGDLAPDELEKRLSNLGSQLAMETSFSWLEGEGELVNRIQQTLELGEKGIVINPAAYTHTSVAIRDALLAVELPFIEVHISNVHAREEFRRDSLISDIASGVVFGFGVLGYELALRGLYEILIDQKGTSGR